MGQTWPNLLFPMCGDNFALRKDVLSCNSVSETRLQFIREIGNEFAYVLEPHTNPMMGFRAHLLTENRVTPHSH